MSAKAATARSAMAPMGEPQGNTLVQGLRRYARYSRTQSIQRLMLQAAKYIEAGLAPVKK
jgi:hypothetical protein